MALRLVTFLAQQGLTLLKSTCMWRMYVLYMMMGAKLWVFVFLHRSRRLQAPKALQQQSTNLAPS